MAIRGCLVKKNADQTTANYSAGVALTWDTEVYDTDAFHDTGSDTSRITIPAAVNGKFGIITACISMSLVTAGSNVAMQINKGGVATYIGLAATTREAVGNGQASTSNWLQIASAPLLLATGDIYEVLLVVSDTSITVESESSFGLLVLDYFSTGRVLCNMVGDQSTANYSTPAVVAFDQNVYDTHNIHSTSSNNTKLIIPASLNGKHVIVGAQMDMINVTANSVQAVAIRKNGSLTYNGFGANSGSSGNYADAGIQAWTQAIQVATGDEFEALHYIADNSVTLLGNTTSLGLRTVT